MSRLGVAQQMVEELGLQRPEEPFLGRTEAGFGGGPLMLALVLIVIQWASPRPVIRNSLMVLLALPPAAGVLLSLSRASWAGLAAGLVLVGALRYRRILVLALVGCVGVLATSSGDIVMDSEGWL